MAGAASNVVAVKKHPRTRPEVYLLVALLDHLAVGLVLPLLPAYAIAAGFPAHLTALLGSLYGLSQLFGAPVVFAAAARWGGRRVMAGR
jgi:MFS family permease